ncbi:MAG: hypothetical protein ACRDM7_10965 [Thermoleophilaceae bacterium]
MLRISVPILLGALLVLAPAAQAQPLNAGPPILASASNPLAACPPDGSGINFPGAEVEPWIEVNPTDVDNIVGFYHQDRYSNGGAKGNVAAVSMNGGGTWTQVAVPNDTRCTGGAFQRSSDPWTSFGPTGTLHAMSLVTDPDPPTGGFGANGMTYNRSTDGGVTWEPAIRLITDPAGRFPNDKNSITADPNDAAYVYAVWDRLQQAGRELAPNDNPRGNAFKGPIYFTRTVNGGDSWSRRGRSTRRGRTSRRSATRWWLSPPAKAARCSTSSATSPTRRSGAAASVR